MKTTDCLVSCDQPEQAILDLAKYEIAFLFARTPTKLNLHWLSQHPDLLNFLVADITRNPRNLIAHVQRICLCYQGNLSEHLYGAMVDLFAALDGRAEDFCNRLLDKVLPKLNPSHAYLLNQYLFDKDINMLHMVQNSFVVSGKGLLGSLQVVSKLAESEAPNAVVQDSLALARDYIEYSQFDEAKSVLENAILEKPAREELHQDLLELYKSLQDVQGYLALSEKLALLGNPFPGLWSQLHEYFNTKKLI